MKLADKTWASTNEIGCKQIAIAVQIPRQQQIKRAVQKILRAAIDESGCTKAEGSEK